MFKVVAQNRENRSSYQVTIVSIGNLSSRVWLEVNDARIWNQTTKRDAGCAELKSWHLWKCREVKKLIFDWFDCPFKHCDIWSGTNFADAISKQLQSVQQFIQRRFIRWHLENWLGRREILNFSENFDFLLLWCNSSDLQWLSRSWSWFRKHDIVPWSQISLRVLVANRLFDLHAFLQCQQIWDFVCRRISGEVLKPCCENSLDFF